MPPSEDIKELLRLTRDNNHLLHKMRRNAIWGGIIKFLVYTGLLVVLPAWAYITYLAPIVNSMNAAVQQMQGTGAKASAQMSDLQNMLNKIKSPFSSQ